MSVIDFAARLAGVPQDLIDEVEAAAPHMAKLLQLFKDNEVLIKQAQKVLADAQPVITEGQALYAKLAPLIGPAMDEIDELMPAARDILAFVQEYKSAPTPGGDT